MNYSSLSRRGALAAVAGSTVALVAPGAAGAATRASAPSAGSTVRAASVNQLLSELSEGQKLQIAVEEKGSSVGAGLLTDRRMSTGDPYSTYGWDTVSAVRVTDVNRAIADDPDGFPSAWKGSIAAGPFSNLIEGSGTFGTWSIRLGGSQEELFMEVPFDATLKATPKDGAPVTTAAVTGGSAFLRVRLDLLASPDGEDEVQLRVATVKAGKVPDVTVTEVTYASPAKDDPQLDSALMTLLQTYFNHNLRDFRHVFARVSLGQNGTGDLGWLRPTSTAYAYRAGVDDKGNPSLDNSYMGLLCMTEGRPAGDAEITLGSDAVLPDERAGLNISVDRMMHKMIIPGLCRRFNASPSDFQHHEDGSITSDNLQLDPISALGEKYETKVTYFRVGFAGSQLVMDLNASIHVAPGHEATVGIGYSLTPRLATQDGKQYIVYEGKELRRETGMEIAWWAKVLETVLAVVVAVTTFGVGLLAETVVETMVIMAIGLLTTTALAAPNLLNGKIVDGLPSIDNLLENATTSIQWANAKEFTVGTVLFDGGLRLGGSYHG